MFGRHAGSRPNRAAFWLLDAPDSLSEQSRKGPGGAVICTFGSEGGARGPVSERPLAAWEDRAFAREARQLGSATFLAQVRYASTGARTMTNTHPSSRTAGSSHNGAFHGLARLEQRLQELGVAGLVHGQTDNERLFALITAEAAVPAGM